MVGTVALVLGGVGTAVFAQLAGSSMVAAIVSGGPDALGQVRVFFLAPLVGAAITGLVHRALATRTAHID